MPILITIFYKEWMGWGRVMSCSSVVSNEGYEIQEAVTELINSSFIIAMKPKVFISKLFNSVSNSSSFTKSFICGPMNTDWLIFALFNHRYLFLNYIHYCFFFHKYFHQHSSMCNEGRWTSLTFTNGLWEIVFKTGMKIALWTKWLVLSRLFHSHKEQQNLV